MLVIKQKMIYRSDLQANPNILYIFGDNTERVGFGGQAKEMRGERNAFGIVTKRKAAHGSKDCYFWDDEQDARDLVQNDFDNLEDLLTRCVNPVYSAKDPFTLYWKAIIIPTDGIGTGLAKLNETAPNLLNLINTRLNTLTTYEIFN